MAAKTLYFLPDTAATGSNQARLQDGGSAPGAANAAAGWTVGSNNNKYSAFKKGSKQASSTFSTTVLPTTTIDNTNGNSFRSESTINGTFANADWSFNFRAISTAVGAGALQQDAVRVRVFRSTDATGQSGLTEITAATQQGTTITGNTSVAQDSVVTWSPGGTVTLTSEYLFVSVALKTIVGAGGGGSGSADWLLRTGSAAAITTSDFTDASAANASAAQNMEVFTQSAVTTAQPAAAASQSIPTFSQTATAVGKPAITGAQVGAEFIQSATAVRIGVVDAAQSMAVFSQLATAILDNGGLLLTGDQSMAAFTQDATTERIGAIAGAQTGEAFGQSATAGAAPAAEAVQAMEAFSQAAAAIAVAQASAAQTMLVFGQSAALELQPARMAGAAQAMDAFAQSARAHVVDPSEHASSLNTAVVPAYPDTTSVPAYIESAVVPAITDTAVVA